MQETEVINCEHAYVIKAPDLVSDNFGATVSQCIANESQLGAFLFQMHGILLTGDHC